MARGRKIKTDETLLNKPWLQRSLKINEDIAAKGCFHTSVDEKRFLALALAGEVGELCNIIKKQWRGDEIANEDIRKEIADCFVYLSLLAVNYGMDDIDYHISKKLDEVEQRSTSSCEHRDLAVGNNGWVACKDCSYTQQF